MKAVGHNVVVKIVEKQTMSGIIHVVQDNKQEFSFGDVVSVGSDVKDIACGDHIIFPTHILKPFKHGEIAYGVIDNRHIFAVLDKE